jgi:CBS domain-containing protein
MLGRSISVCLRSASRHAIKFRSPVLFSQSQRFIRKVIVQDFLKELNQVNLHSILPTKTVKDAAVEMEKYKIGALVVADEENKPRGIVTARDIQKVVAREDMQETDLVEDIMTPQELVRYVYPRDNLYDVASLMVEHNIRHILVVHNEQNVGILSMKDVMREVLEQQNEEATALRHIIEDSYSKQD